VAEFGGKVAYPGEAHWTVAANNAGVPAHVLTARLQRSASRGHEVSQNKALSAMRSGSEGMLSRMGNGECGAEGEIANLGDWNQQK